MTLDKLRDIFIDSCNRALELQNLNGEMPAGHNGSYQDMETPIRNTAHWLISLSKAYELTKAQSYYDAITKTLASLKDKKWRPGGKTFYCRDKKNKDKCNGLIGQAWVIEGLIKGYEITKDKEALFLAQEIFMLHPFCNKRKIWRKVEPDGQILNFDLTFNHQLWFAMSGFLILKFIENQNIESQCIEFFNNIPKNLRLSRGGRIGQSMKLGFIEDTLKLNAKRVLRKDQVNYMKLKEVGYHAFNTFAFSKIYTLNPGLQFFQSKMYLKIITYLTSDEYRNNISISNYGFAYNPPGFEVLYTYQINNQVLNKSKNFVTNLIDLQIKNHYDHQDNSFTKNVHDKNTSSARIYELSECL